MSSLLSWSSRIDAVPRGRAPISRAAIPAIPAIPVIVVALGVIVTACESRTNMSTGPSPSKCGVALTGTASLDSVGGVGTITITTQPECAWTASTVSPWISGLSPTSGQGNGRVEFRAAANPNPSVREAEIAVNDDRLRITQSAGACGFTLAPASQTLGAGAATGGINITTTAGCAWSVASSASWLTVTGSATGTASGTITFSIAPNTGGERSATITAGGQTATVRQSGADGPAPPSCTYTITPPGQTFAAAGGTGAPVTVTTAAECAWTAASAVPWITVIGGSAGTGSGTLMFSVAANTGAARSGTIVVASQLFTVTQEAQPEPPLCAVTIAPGNQSVGSGAGNGASVTVTAPAGCAWTASSNVGWLTILSGASGSGNGTVTFRFDANPAGFARTGSLAIGGQTFTVEQAPAPCSFTTDPRQLDVSAGGASGASFGVQTLPGCAWSASSNTPWITLTAGGLGSGSGFVSLNVSANTGSARNGTVTITGQAPASTTTLAVNQAALQCSYGLAPTSSSPPASGAADQRVDVTASDGACGWTATSNASWLTITTGSSGAGNGTVTYRVAANTGGARTGTLTIAGQPFTVNQGPVQCSHSLSATGSNQPASGAANQSVDVTSTAGSCAWTATSNAPWLTITAGSSGTGNGTVSYSVAANTGAARVGTLTIAGQAFTVNQAAVQCSLGLSATSANAPASGATNQSFNVTATSGTCTWTATSNVAWVTITAGSSGTGNGPVRYNVSANPGVARTGTLTVAGQTFTVNQAGCAYTISPTSQNHPLQGATLRYVTVNNPASCTWPWTATSNVPWITIDPPGSGTGAGFITYTIGATTAPRSGTLNVAGQTFTASQP